MTVNFEIENTLEEVMPTSGVVGEIEYNAPYALYIEFDTEYADSNVPFDPIYEWVQREWQNLAPVREAAEESLGPDPSTEELQRKAAWIVIENMDKQEGIRFGRRAIEEGKDKADMVANIHAERENPYEEMARNLVEIMYEHSQGTIENEAKSSGTLKEMSDWEVRRVDE